MLENNVVVERWLPVVGYEGCYEVSNRGRVRSLDRLISNGNGFTRRVKGRVLKPVNYDDYGHKSVTLCLDGARSVVLIHRLVLTMFVGACPDGLIGCHNNGDPEDNRLENLRWATWSENGHDRVRHGNDVHKNRTHCPRGHRLDGLNLEPSQQAKGYRTCRACGWAKKLVHRPRDNDEQGNFKLVSDECYKKIMSGVVPSAARCRTHCPRAHRLVEPNLIRSLASRGHRGCLACDLARGEVRYARRRGIEIDLQEASDRRYERIMAGME